MANKREYLCCFERKRIYVSLGIGQKGYFEGVGAMIASSPHAPNFIFILYPTFLAPNDSVCTISNGALKSYAGFTNIIIHTAQKLALTHRSGVSFDLPIISKDNIDYIKLDIFHGPRLESSARPQFRHLSLQPAPIHHPALQNTPQLSWMLHIRYNHRSLSVLQSMVDAGLIKGVKGKLAPLPGRCPICDAAKATKLRRGGPVDTTELPVGTRIHIDFTFFNTTSLRGFTSALMFVEATERYCWFFPTRSKRPPIELVLFFITYLRRQGLPINNIRTDEGGEFACSEEFCKMLYKGAGTVLETTGGYASTINGMAESPNKTFKRGIRCSLMGSNLPDIFWCFAGQYQAVIHNNSLNRITKKAPSQGFCNKFVPASKIFPFGSRAKIIYDLPTQRALSARTAGDTRSILNDAIYPHEVRSLPDSPSSFDGVFLGFSNNPAVSLILKNRSSPEQPNRVVRAHHVIIDPYGLSASPTDVLTPNENILRQLQLRNGVKLSLEEFKSQVPSSKLDTVSSPFDPSTCETFVITLPPRGTTIGLSFVTDEDFTLPVIVRINPTKPVYSQIPLRHHFAKSWLIAVQADHPITGAGAVESLHYLQLPNSNRDVEITLCPIQDPVRHNYQHYRAIFDSCTGLQHAHMMPIGLQHSHMAVLPEPPTVHNSFHKNLDGPLKQHWIQAAEAQYTKNSRVGLFSKPTPIEHVPKDKKVLQTVLAPKVKRKGDNTYEFVARHCTNGSKQEQGVDFDHSYSPTASSPSIRFQLIYAAVYCLRLGITDVVNCFQSTLIPEEKRVITSVPPYYMSWFRREFPEIKLEHSPSGRYVLQAMKGLQGDKQIGRQWYHLCKMLFEKFGLLPCWQESALYRYQKDGVTLLVNTSTDDFLCAYSNDDIFAEFITYMKKHLNLTAKSDTVLEYLNLRIVQTDAGISYDQTEHIQNTIVNKFFPPQSTERLKTVHTPFRTDSEFENDLVEQLPATGDELKALEKQYKGTFPSIIGQIMHVYVWSRPELGFTCGRLSRYTTSPNAAAFAGLYRALRFLATHTHRPIMYPRRSIDGYHTLRVNFDPPKFQEIKLSNGLIIIVDSDHARDKRTRRSCHCVLTLLAGVLADWKHNQQNVVAIHSTDSEIRGVFAAVKRGLYLQEIALFIGFPQDSILPTPILEDSQPCIDTLNALTVTSRVKHIAVPIHYIHQQIARERFEMQKIGTQLTPADSGTKPSSAPVLFRQSDYAIGVRFYPAPGTDHYKLSQLELFRESPHE